MRDKLDQWQTVLDPFQLSELNVCIARWKLSGSLQMFTQIGRLSAERITTSISRNLQVSHTHTHIFPVRRARWSLWWQFFLARSWTVCGSCQYEDQSAPKGWRGIFQAQLFPWPTLGANQWKDARLHHKGLVHLMVHKFANLKNVIISVKETSCFYGQGDRVLPTGSPAGSKQAKR